MWHNDILMDFMKKKHCWCYSIILNEHCVLYFPNSFLAAVLRVALLCRKLDKWFIALAEWGHEYSTVSTNRVLIHSFELLEVLCLINPCIT